MLANYQAVCDTCPIIKKKINIMLFENSMYCLNKLIHKLQIHLGLLILYIPSCDLKEFN